MTVTGDHNQLHVTFALPFAVLDALPDEICSDEGISLHPVLFNTGLQELGETTEQYKFEQSLNEASFLKLRDYYRSVR